MVSSVASSAVFPPNWAVFQTHWAGNFWRSRVAVFWPVSVLAAVLSGNQWSVDTADELIIAYGSKPVARAAWQETIGCIIHNTKDKSNIRYAKHIVKLQITRGT